MSTKSKEDWQLLAQHENWSVEYRADSRIVRLNIGGEITYLERESYQLLWGVLTQGLDELERVEEESARFLGLSPSIEANISLAPTQH